MKNLFEKEVEFSVFWLWSNFKKETFFFLLKWHSKIERVCIKFHFILHSLYVGKKISVKNIINQMWLKWTAKDKRTETKSSRYLHRSSSVTNEKCACNMNLMSIINYYYQWIVNKTIEIDEFRISVLYSRNNREKLHFDITKKKFSSWKIKRKKKKNVSACVHEQNNQSLIILIHQLPIALSSSGFRFVSGHRLMCWLISICETLFIKYETMRRQCEFWGIIQKWIEISVG